MARKASLYSSWYERLPFVVEADFSAPLNAEVVDCATLSVASKTNREGNRESQRIRTIGSKLTAPCGAVVASSLLGELANLHSYASPGTFRRVTATNQFTNGQRQFVGECLAPREEPWYEHAFGETEGHRFLRPVNRSGRFRKRELPLDIRLSKSPMDCLSIHA